ncbi:MAG: hypothetical protein WCF57_11370 [Pyrinomonadaceae bacterium]
MRTNRSNLALALGVLLAATVACNYSFTTANISKLKLGKDKNAQTETDKFGPKDTVYGVATISNTSNKQKVKIRLLYDDVKGQDSGKLFPGTEASSVISGASDVPLNFSPPANGWANGRYKVEFTMYNEEGDKQVDQKTATFNVSGASSSSASSSNPPPANDNEEEGSSDEGGDHGH